jgi:hypothetical protein
MNANIITSRVPRLSVISLNLFAAVCFAGRAQAQTLTTPPQVLIESKMVEPTAQSSRDLGSTLLADNSQSNNKLLAAPTPVPPNFEQNFAGFRHANTLSFGEVETLLGFEYKYREQTRDDVKRITDTYSGDALVQIGTGKGTELYFDFPFQTYNDTTIKDRTGQDSFTRSGNGDLRGGFQYNFVGNAGGPFHVAGSLDFSVPTKSFNGNDFPRLSLTQSDNNDNNNNDNTSRRDRNRNSDNWGGGVSLQASVDLHCGWELGVDSGVMGIHSHCGCYYCFDNRLNLTKTLCNEWAVEATVDTTFSTARRSEVQAVLIAGARWTPEPKLGFCVGPSWNATQCGNNIGAFFEVSYQWP